MSTNISSRERVRHALTHRNSDRVPMDFGGTNMSSCNSEFLVEMRTLLGFPLPDNRDADGTWVDEAIQRYLGVDLRWVPNEPPLVLKRDLNSTEYGKALAARQAQSVSADVKTPGIHTEFPLEGADISYFKSLRPAPQAPPIWLDWCIDTAKAYRASGFATSLWLECGYFETACWSRGYEQVACDLVAEPDLLRTWWDVQLEEKLARIECVAKPLAPYIDIFLHGDDFGLQSAPFMSPGVFEDVIAPYYKTQYAALHAAAPDSYIFHHSCGSVYPLLDTIIDMGVDVLNPIQPLAVGMEPEALKAKGKGRIAFHGGMDLQQLLPFGSPEDVTREAAERIRILGEGGGFICAPAHALPGDVPVENILALFGH